LRYLIFLLMTQQAKNGTPDPIHSIRWDENLKNLRQEFVTKEK